MQAINRSTERRVVAAVSRRRAPSAPVTPRRLARLLVRRPWVPAGTVHSYTGRTLTTDCELPLDSLTLFPEIDWPAGAFGNPRCPVCDARVIDDG